MKGEWTCRNWISSACQISRFMKTWLLSYAIRTTQSQSRKSKRIQSCIWSTKFSFMTSNLLLRLPSPIQIWFSSDIRAVPTKSGCRVVTTSMGCLKKSLKFFSEKMEAEYFNGASMPNKTTSHTCKLRQRANSCFQEIKAKIKSERCAYATFQSGTTRVKTLANLAAARILVA